MILLKNLKQQKKHVAKMTLPNIPRDILLKIVKLVGEKRQ